MAKRNEKRQSLMYLFDTNVLVLAIKGEKSESEFLWKLVKRNRVYISVVTIAEYLSKANEEEVLVFENLVIASKLLLVDEVIARIAAEYRKESLKRSKVYLLDCLLAAQAKFHNLTVVTNDKLGFSMKGIKVVSPSKK